MHHALLSKMCGLITSYNYKVPFIQKKKKKEDKIDVYEAPCSVQEICS